MSRSHAASRFRDLLSQTVASFCSLSDTQVTRLESHYELMLLWNRRLNLTSVTRLEEAVVRHYGESLFLGARLPVEPLTIADVGSGAGFPGVPMAVLRSDCRFTLIEAHQRKSVFLKEATRGYGNVNVAPVRAEAVTERFDWMVCRAVRWDRLPRLGRKVALLLGEEDAGGAAIDAVEWKERMSVPWGDRRVLLIGE